MTNESTLVLHLTTKRQLEAFTNAPSHALLLSGPSGSGKLATAQFLAENLLELEPGRLEHYPYAVIIRPEDNKALGIEAVRELEAFLKLMVPNQKSINRLLIIESADTLTLEAQNALLKHLEEPPRGAVFILTTSQPQALLPTIRSRTQSITIIPPNRSAITDYFTDQSFTDQSVQQAYTLSGGLAGLMQALLTSTEHPLVEATKTARELLQATTYDRLLTVDSLAKQRELVSNMLFILQQMASVSLQTAQPSTARRWRTILEASYKAATEISGNAQPKLALTNLMLNLG